jgi:flavin reductase (DIM6/NTAB) family NADH-FMN oxidoreductase RutF
MAVDDQAFRAGMRHLTAHVCLITTKSADGERHGLTATAVCSVSASPPTLLCCVNRNSSSHAAIRASGILAVNVLAVEDKALADRFAGAIRGEARFAAGLWGQLETGAPVLESALATFDCRLANAVDVTTHGILFGEIQAVRVRPNQLPQLLYAHGTYGGFTSLDAARGSDLLWIPTWDWEQSS